MHPRNSAKLITKVRFSLCRCVRKKDKCNPDDVCPDKILSLVSSIELFFIKIRYDRYSYKFTTGSACVGNCTPIYVASFIQEMLIKYLFALILVLTNEHAKYVRK